jgi:hypothetical protein
MYARKAVQRQLAILVRCLSAAIASRIIEAFHFGSLQAERRGHFANEYVCRSMVAVQTPRCRRSQSQNSRSPGRPLSVLPLRLERRYRDSSSTPQIKICVYVSAQNGLVFARTWTQVWVRCERRKATVVNIEAGKPLPLSQLPKCAIDRM